MGRLIHLKQAPTPTVRVNLTKTVIDRFTYDPDGSSWQVLWDSQIENLGVRVGARTKKWVLRYRNAAGKQRLWNIGPTSKLTVRRVRELAENANARIVLGEDPSVQKQQARKAPDEDTFEALAQQWIDEYAKPKRKSWVTDAARLLADPADVDDDDAKATRLAAPVRALHALRPGHDSQEVIEDALKLVHEQIAERAPVEADRVVQTVNACLNWHVKQRNIPRGFVNIGQGVDLNGWKAREDYIRPAELPAFASAVQSLPLVWKGAIWLMLLTGSRSKSEALSLRWENVHLRAGEFVYPATKNGTAHRLPITAGVRAILDAMPNQGEWVFPGRKGGPLQDSRKMFVKVRAVGFVDHITPHALRHTARTYLQTKLKTPGPTVDAVTNHATHGMAGNYTHVHLDDVSAALTELERYLLKESKIKDFAKYLATKPKKEAK